MTNASMATGTVQQKILKDVKVSCKNMIFLLFFLLIFFQFSECKCNIAGIVSNDGCDQVTGSCTCKRFVTGRDCDQCMEEHYGLSESDPNGCTPCDCDVGGAYDNHCDVLTGQCKCRPEVKGRRCDEVKDGYFTGALDYLLFEGELAHGSQNPVSSIIKKFLISNSIENNSLN